MPFKCPHLKPCIDAPPSILAYVKSQTTITDLDASLTQRQRVLNTIKENLKKCRQKMENQANQKRRDCTFEAGDPVWLRMQMYKQQMVH